MMHSNFCSALACGYVGIGLAQNVAEALLNGKSHLLMLLRCLNVHRRYAVHELLLNLYNSNKMSARVRGFNTEIYLLFPLKIFG